MPTRGPAPSIPRRPPRVPVTTTWCCAHLTLHPLQDLGPWYYEDDPTHQPVRIPSPIVLHVTVVVQLLTLPDLTQLDRASQPQDDYTALPLDLALTLNPGAHCIRIVKGR